MTSQLQVRRSCAGHGTGGRALRAAGPRAEDAERLLRGAGCPPPRLETCLLCRLLPQVSTFYGLLKILATMAGGSQVVAEALLQVGGTPAGQRGRVASACWAPRAASAHVASGPWNACPRTPSSSAARPVPCALLMPRPASATCCATCWPPPPCWPPALCPPATCCAPQSRWGPRRAGEAGRDALAAAWLALGALRFSALVHGKAGRNHCVSRFTLLPSSELPLPCQLFCSWVTWLAWRPRCCRPSPTPRRPCCRACRPCPRSRPQVGWVSRWIGQGRHAAYCRPWLRALTNLQPS